MGTSENIQAWSKTAGTNASADSSINFAEGQDPGSVNNSARSVMAATKKYAEDRDGGLAAGGTGDAVTLTTNQVLSAGHIAAGLTLSFRATATNTGATTLNVDSTGAVSIVSQYGAALSGGEIVLGGIYTVAYNANTSKWVLQTPAVPKMPSGYLYGLTLSNNASDATNDIDIAVGEALDGGNAYFMKLASGLTKRLDASWAVGTGNGGLDTGSIADTTYHVWLIARSDTGVVDVLFSASASSPTMPSNYTYKRRIGSILRESSAIVAFTQDGDTFLRSVIAGDVAAASAGTTATLAALSVPAGLAVQAIISSRFSISTPSAGTSLLISSPSQTDSTPSVTLMTHHLAAAQSSACTFSVLTDTSRQVRYRASASGGTLYITTIGWVDRRGRLG